MYKILLIVTCMNFYCCVYERFSLHFHVVSVHLSMCMIWWSYSKSPIYIYERSMFYCHALISLIIMCNKTFSPSTGLCHPCLMSREPWVCRASFQHTPLMSLYFLSIVHSILLPVLSHYCFALPSSIA